MVVEKADGREAIHLLNIAVLHDVLYEPTTEWSQSFLPNLSNRLYEPDFGVRHLSTEYLRCT